MKNIRKKTIMIATFGAIMSLTMGFMPQSEAGSIPLTLNFGLTCGVSIPGSTIALTGGPTYTGSFQLTNTGNGVQAVLGNIGDGWSGTEDATLHLPADTTTLASTTTGDGAVGPIAMDGASGGTNVIFAQVVGGGGASTISISVDASTPISPPYSGEQSTTLFITADSGNCHA